MGRTVMRPGARVDGTTTHARYAMRSRLTIPMTIATVLFAVFAYAVPAAAEVPYSLIQQGRLVDDAGEPVTGEVELTVTLYDSETDFESEHILWEDDVEVEADDEGFYTTVLGRTENPIDPPVLAHEEVWLGIAVNGGDEMSPRFRLHSVPYASIAAEAESVADGGLDSDALSDDIEVPWDNLADRPEGLDDGDDDTLGGMSCNDGQRAEYDGSDWTCAPAIKQGSVTPDHLKNSNVLYKITADGCSRTGLVTLESTCKTQKCDGNDYYYEKCSGTCDYGQNSAKTCNNQSLGHLVKN